MKTLISIFFLTACFTLSAQSIQKTKVEILDQEQRKAKPIFSQDYQEITFTLFEVTDLLADKKERKLSVSLENAETEVLYRTIGINIGGLLDGASASAASKQNVANSSIELTVEDLDNVKAFLNETLAYKNAGAKNPVTYSLTFSDRFTLGFAKQSNNWKYFVKMDNNVFEIEYSEGVNMFKRLMGFREQMVRV